MKLKRNMRIKSKNQKQLASFIKFCILHPDLSFWRTLNVWSKSAFIIKADKFDSKTGEFKGIKDTFYE